MAVNDIEIAATPDAVFDPGRGLPMRLGHKLGNLVLRGRNFLSLERLQELAEDRG